jgi:hypothetical protein
MSDPSRSADHLRDALHGAADELSLEPIEPTAIRGRAATRRRRRRSALGAGVGVVAITLVGAVVANRDRGDDTLEFTNPPETTQPDANEDATLPTTPITTPPTMVPVETDPGPGLDGADAPAPTGDLIQLVPWRDGFLSIGILNQPQPLGPIPEEISALFPDEVRDLFPDGLPPTIEEATNALSEAGLLDEVSAVLAAHPEASEAIYANERPPSALVADFTTDGESWSSVELAPPVDHPESFTSSGDRLVASSTNVAGDDGRLVVTVAWTDDLTTWHTESIDLAPIGATAPPYQQTTYVNSIAVVGDQWVARVERHAWVDHESLLPADIRAEIADSEFGYGMSSSDSGITVDIERADGSRTTYEFSWAELGLDSNPDATPFTERGAGTLIVGDFGGGVEEIALPAAHEYGTVIAGESGFYLVGEQLATSTDGRTWTPLDGLPAERYVNSVATLDSGELFVVDGPSGTELWLHSDGAFNQVDLPELGLPYGLWNPNTTGSWIVELHEGGDVEEPYEPVTVVVEYEGFELTVVNDVDGSSYSLVDIATRGVLAEGATTDEPSDDPRDSIWEYDTDTGATTVVIRDAGGNEIVRIPGTLLSEAYEELWNGIDPTVPAGDWTPDFWLIATTDGTDWLTLDIADPSPESSYWPLTAARNGRTVLYQTVDGWALAEL